MLLQATKNVLDVARERGTSHFVLLSAICVQKPLLEFQRAKLKLEADLQVGWLLGGGEWGTAAVGHGRDRSALGGGVDAGLVGLLLFHCIELGYRCWVCCKCGTESVVLVAL
jgi:hypothetical protein